MSLGLSRGAPSKGLYQDAFPISLRLPICNVEFFRTKLVEKQGAMGSWLC